MPLLPLEQALEAWVEEAREETCRLLGADRNQRAMVVGGRRYVTRHPLPFTEADRTVRARAWEDLAQRLHEEGRTAWDFWGPEIVRATERLDAFDPTAASGLELAKHLAEALAVRRRHFTLHPLCWFRPHEEYLAAFRALSGREGEAAEAGALRLLEGEETILTQLTDELYELAVAARAAPSLAGALRDDPVGAIERLAILPGSEAFQARWQRFLARYGERTGNGWGSEVTIRHPTWREQPAEVLELLVPFLDPRSGSPAEARTRARNAREREVEALCGRATDPEQVAAFRRQLDQARRVMRVLEEHNHYIDQLGTGQLRRAIMVGADRLVEEGLLATRQDVLWLTFDELLGALRDGKLAVGLGTIAARQREHTEWAALEAPPFLGLPDPLLPERPAWRDEVGELRDAEEGILRGTGASAGQAAGVARVVRPGDPLPALEPGDILVANNVGPRWTPLFPLLGGLVLDGGSLSQHAASTAREYGVPAVIGTRIGTARILDGSRVRIDGATGTVEFEA